MLYRYISWAFFLITYMHVVSHAYGQIVIDEVRFHDNTLASLAVLDYDDHPFPRQYSLYGKGRPLKYSNEESLPHNIFPFDKKIWSSYNKYLISPYWIGGNEEIYKKHFPPVTLKQIKGNQYAAILPPQIKSVQVFLPKIDRAKYLQINYMHYTTKDNPVPIFYLSRYDNIQTTPCKLRIALPYMDWLKDERHENIGMTGFIGIYDENKERLAGKYFVYPPNPGGFATADFRKDIDNESLSVHLLFANGDPAAFARVEIKEKGHNTYLKELDADRNGIITFIPIDVESVKIYPSTNGLMGLWDDPVARTNIELYLPELSIIHEDHNKITALLPEDMKSIHIKYPTMQHGLNFEINTTPYDYDIEYGPYKRIIIDESNLDGPLDIRVPLPYQCKSKYIKYFNDPNYTYTGVVLYSGNEYIAHKSLEVPSAPGVTVVADLGGQ